MSDQYNVVIQLSNDGADVQKSIIKQVGNLINALSDIHIEIVIQSRGINFVFKNSHWEYQLEQMVKENNVRILVCRNTLEALHLKNDDLLPIVELIPSAVAHLVERQHEGWSYLKAGF